MQLSDNYESVLFFSRHKLSYYNVWAAVNARAECWYRKNLLKLRSELQVLTLLKSLLCSFLLFFFTNLRNHQFFATIERQYARWSQNFVTPQLIVILDGVNQDMVQDLCTGRTLCQYPNNVHKTNDENLHKLKRKSYLVILIAINKSR